MQGRVRSRVAGGLAAALVIATAGCGSNGTKAAAVKVTLADFSVGLRPATVTSGPVTFRITNAGPAEHELVVVRTALDPGALPTETNGDVDEHGTGIKAVDEAEDIKPGQTRTLTIDRLGPGSYVLLCNITGHYAAGMRAALTVT